MKYLYIFLHKTNCCSVLNEENFPLCLQSNQFKVFWMFMDVVRQLEMKPKRRRPPPSLKSVHRHTDSINLILCHPRIWEYEIKLFFSLFYFLSSSHSLIFFIFSMLSCNLTLPLYFTLGINQTTVRHSAGWSLIPFTSGVIKSRRGTSMSLFKVKALSCPCVNSKAHVSATAAVPMMWWFIYRWKVRIFCYDKCYDITNLWTP